MALAIGALLLAVVLIFAVIVQSVDAARIPARHEAEQAAQLQDRARTIGERIVKDYWAGATLTTRSDSNRPPAPTGRLRELVESEGGDVWVLDNKGFTIYNSFGVRQFSDADRTILDSAIVTVGAGAVVNRDSTIISDVRTQTVSTSTRQLLLYSAFLGLPQSVNRVVVGLPATVPPPSSTDFRHSFILMVPLLIIISAAAAGAFVRIAEHPIDERVEHVINEVEAITDGRSLHRRLGADGIAGGQLVRLTETLNAMIGRLEQSFAGLRRFTADASHELKTPLTVLRADVERAMSTQGHRGEQMVALEEALAETTRMADLVDSLLTLARADEGRFELYREPVDLEALAREVYETAVLLGEPTKISVSMPSPDRVVVPGDRGRLRQLFLNLVTNAIKYTPARGEVELSLKQTDGVAQFSVRDSGIGIAAADLPHVFERFWRADPARSRGAERSGFGLGLAISQYIAQAHGGSLTVHSRLGRGSTFTAILPITPPDFDGNEK